MRRILSGFAVGGLVLGLSSVGAFAKGKDDKPKGDAPAAKAPSAMMATAELKDAKGNKVGEATLEETPHGVLITADVKDVPAGMHAFHIHETGKCEAPFKTAGGHFNPGGKKHGIKASDGMHAGDLPNVDVPADGKLKVQFLAEGVTLKAGEKNSLLDADGSAIVMHAKADDMMGDPAGNAGDRIACGVVVKK